MVEPIIILLALLVPLVLYVYFAGVELIFIKYRWLFVCLFLMPLSVVFEAFLKLRNWLIFKLKSAPLLHDSKVISIQKQIIKWNKNGKRTPMCTGRPGWLTVSLRIGKYKKTHTKISIDLYDILAIDPKRGTVRLEPLVTMGQVTAALIKFGYTLPVVPELDDLTVGGLIMGCGVETSSHKYGLFQHFCLCYDIIIADGSLIHCSKTENSDLFYGIPWSHGTLGFLVAAELSIIPAKKYVKLTYEPVYNLTEMVEKFTEKANKGVSCGLQESNDFVECIAFSKNEAVIMTGINTDDVEQSKINTIGRYWKPWFCEHVRTYLTEYGNGVEYIPLRDYYHRHTRSLFWEMKDIIPFGNNPIFRYLLGWTMPPKISLLKLTSPQFVLDLYESNHVVQDMLVPISDLKSSLQFFDEILKLYPLWICPLKLKNVPGLVHPKENKDVMYVDIGAYGNPMTKDFHGPATVSKIEEFVIRNNGFQLLYADSYLTRDQFHSMFDHSLYKKLRKELNCDGAFPEVYDKVSRSSRK